MENIVQNIREQALSGKPRCSGGRSIFSKKISFNDLVFMPAQLKKRPFDYFREKISAETVIGKASKKPLKLETPILIGAMSFGALNKKVKIAIAKASSIAGTATNTGEGGMLPEERAKSRFLIAQYSTGRFGVTEKYLRAGDAIELKIGQGAKPGQGGLLPANKVTPLIAKTRKMPVGKPIHSPPYHPDIKSLADLRKKVDWLRKTSGGKPIILKLGAGIMEDDIPIAVRSGADSIAIDGMEGGTGAAPDVMLDHFGTPTLAALVRARKIMDRMRSKQDLIIGGGLNTGADVAKALALGADAIFMGMPILIAMGCMYCKECNKGMCPSGITTQEPSLMKKLDPQAAEHVANFIKACTEEIKMAAAAVGKDDIHKLDKGDLRSLSPTITNITGVKMV